jgi:hypothetical protein
MGSASFDDAAFDIRAEALRDTEPDMSQPWSYFGCEGDDPMVAFERRDPLLREWDGGSGVECGL